MSPLQEGFPLVGLHVLYEPEKSDNTLVDVVFIHGLGGHPISQSWQCDESVTSTTRAKTELLERDESWKLLLRRTRSADRKRRSATASRNNARQSEQNASSLFFWPRDLLPLVCPEARIITWGYHALRRGDEPVTTQPDFSYHAKDLLRELVGLRDSTNMQQKPLVFFAHSLSGIIVMEMLRQAELSNTQNEQDILSSTAAVIFFDCPHWTMKDEPIEDAAVTMAETSFDGKAESSAFSALCSGNNPKWDEAQDAFIRLSHHFNFVVETYQERKGDTERSIHRGLSAGEINCLQRLRSGPVGCRGSRSALKESSLTTCKRICSTKEFSDWYRRQDGSNEQILWLTGALGSGKSTQLQHIRCQMEKQWKPDTTSIIYCTAESQSLDQSILSESRLGDMRSITTIRSLVSQLFVHDPNLREKLSSVYEGDITDLDLTRYFLDDYIMGEPRTLARRTFILIDTEDICDDEYIRELLYCLCLMARNSNFSVCLASRPISEPVPANITQLQLEDYNFEDIEWLVQSRLRTDWEQRSVAVKDVAEKAGCSFLWAQLATNLLNEVIDGGGTYDLVHKALGELPTDIYELYERVLGTLSSKEKADAIVVMRWVMLSPEPMVLNDLRMAVRLSRTSFMLCYDPQTALDVGMPWSMQELQKTGKHFDTPSQFYQWLCSRTCGLLEARSSDAEGKAQQSLGLQHIYPINDSVRSFFLSGRGFTVLSLGRTPTIPPGHTMVDLCHYSLLRTILVYLNTSDLSPLVSGNHSPEPRQSASPLEMSPAWQRNVRDQRNLILSSYPFLGYAVDNLLYHLLSPRPLRYFLPQQAIFNTFASNDCRIWRRWTALLGETDASAILTRCKSAEALLQPEFGASFRLERVFRAVHKMTTSDSWFLPRKSVELPPLHAPEKPEEDQGARSKFNTASGLPVLRATQRGLRSRGTLITTTRS
ncbi:hypothetical protein FHL15_003262 [Xylaria flabelliformis]|uniref:Nephrocystin 3-like N-terminal domain-containing protein n=1 Tax=Xylaria flabelliformis TaxID=2512241 RepID=A0A553I684_9PEZI|nr:hypothetical protein FHL15_003262 [Xylaria flabelliformis]